MSGQHTQGRLVVRLHNEGLSGDLETTDDVIANDIFHANARRLAACWNACEGFDTELLENTAGGFKKLIVELRSDNGEKADLLKRSVAMLGEASRHVGKVEAERDQLRADRDAAQALLRDVLDEADAWAKECGTALTDERGLLKRIRALPGAA